jgi:hypothetical protein
MPFTGTIQSWQDDRGFGFIEPAQGGQAVFVHIKSFTSRGGSRPQGTCSPSRYPDRSGASSGVKVNVLGHK